ncbi:MAG TPA: TIGR03364 family FAD-dependent oxidoreductase [Candidatus Solibacter sp.]|nr:TIGR03364 family FAD-dependent oxidoreductase [Candidatus Solibacter sp.]
MTSGRTFDIAIVGAGIMGLAHAYAAAKRGWSVIVFDRGLRASGASIRNFGMVWPIGQPHGTMLELALRSRQIWQEVLECTKLPYRPHGSLHVVYRQDEAEVSKEFAEIAPALGYECQWLDRGGVLEKTGAVREDGLLGGMFSPVELTVDPPRTIAALADFLVEQFHVVFRFGCAITHVDAPAVESADERWQASRVIVCSGADFETLFPATYAAAGLTRVKLQMMRTGPQPRGWQLGPALAAGLTLRFYPAFETCKTLPALKRRISEETPEYDRWGIHGLVSQLSTGELTLGDSHEYGLAVDIFNKQEIDELMLRYIGGFLNAPDLSIAQRWYGVYAKHPEKPYLSIEPVPGVRIVTSPGGSGMTLSFAIGERTIGEFCR